MTGSGVKLGQRKVIESKAHRGDKAKVAIAVDLAPQAIHIGSTAIQLLLRDRPDNLIAGRVAPTADADILLSQVDANSLADKYGATLQNVAMVAIDQTTFGMLQVRRSRVEEPFGLLRLDSDYQPIRELFRNLDIFTERTGVGPIPVTDYVINEGYRIIKVGDMEVKVARPFFVIATQTNPFALTEARAKRLILLMLQAYVDDPATYRNEMEMALLYLSYGGKNAAEMVATDPTLIKRAEFRNYGSRIINVGTKLWEYRKKIINMAAQMDIGEAVAEEVRQVTAAYFLSYGASFENPLIESGLKAVCR